jgi:hypothetical protein
MQGLLNDSDKDIREAAKYAIEQMKTDTTGPGRVVNGRDGPQMLA